MKRIDLNMIALTDKDHMYRLIEDVLCGECEIEESPGRILNTELLVKQAMTEDEVLIALRNAVKLSCESPSANKAVVSAAMTWCVKYLEDDLSKRIGADED